MFIINYHRLFFSDYRRSPPPCELLCTAGGAHKGTSKMHFFPILLLTRYVMVLLSTNSKKKFFFKNSKIWDPTVALFIMRDVIIPSCPPKWHILHCRPFYIVIWHINASVIPTYTWRSQKQFLVMTSLMTS